MSNSFTSTTSSPKPASIANSPRFKFFNTNNNRNNNENESTTPTNEEINRQKVDFIEPKPNKKKFASRTSNSTSSSSSNTLNSPEKQIREVIKRLSISDQGSNEEPIKSGLSSILETFKTEEDEEEKDEKQESSSKLIVVSNRLPVTLKRDEKGNISFAMSSGGLVSALNGMGKKFSWVGWLGDEIINPEEEEEIKQKLSERDCYPVFLEKKLADSYYNSFSNGILWPLFHYLYDNEQNFKQTDFEAYRDANLLFSNAVLEIYKPGDFIWVHDYHLMLVPKMLRNEIPEGKIGWFLHIPFPSSEIYRTLPVRAELLDGVLASNLLGFHTFDYCRHFLSSCMRTLGCEVTAKGLVHAGLSVTCGVFPIGIEPEKFVSCLEMPETKNKIKEFQEKFAGKKILLGIDRLDYTKGLPNKFQALERFLQLYPDMAQNVVLIQVGVPTRESVQKYQDLIKEVNESVGRINSKFGSIGSLPIHYIHKSVSFTELCALYYVADVCLVTAIRDGMNLVSYEYIACQREKCGVLLLSEFAGAANSLSGSILINPFDVESTANEIYNSLIMNENDRKIRFVKNEGIVFEQNTAVSWGSRFLEDLEKACTPECYLLTNTPLLDRDLVLKKYNEAKKRIFFLDYDGTLVNIQKYAHLATPTSELMRVLKELSRDPKNDIYIVSGRDRSDLEKWFGHLPIGLTAEHGMVCRLANKTEWVSLYQDFDLSWMQIVEPILKHVVSRVPGSYLEVKSTSLCFHYRNVESHYGQFICNELRLHLTQALVNMPIDVITGKKVLEVRCVGVNKGVMVKKILKSYDENFNLIFCAGDDKTDEDIFKAFHGVPESFTVFVGKPDSHTYADHRAGTPKDMLEILNMLVTRSG